LGEAHRPYPASVSNPTNPATVTLPPYLPDDPIAREDFARYHDSIAIVDAKVGAILDQLDRDGLRENTLVFFFGDNGRECFRGKYFAYEQGTHVPLIVRWPGHVSPGMVSDDLVSLIDVTAESLVDAGIPLPASLQGQPFLAADAKKRDYLVTARDRIDETPDRVRTIRDARYKYIRNYQPERPYLQRMLYAEATNPNFNLMRDLMAQGKLNAAQAKFMASHRPAEELYDLRTDPFELNDLSTSHDAREPLDRLRAALERWEKDTRDQGVTPEDPATEARIIAEHDRKMSEQFNADGSKKKKRP
jgi:arylsulfatase A-like enzyme